MFYRRDGLSALSPSHPLAEISASATSHLSAPHIDYLIHWTALLLLEDSYTSGPAQKDLWCLDPEERYVVVMILMSPFERASLNSWAPPDCSLHPPVHLKMEAPPASEALWTFWSTTVDIVQNFSHDCDHIPHQNTIKSYIVFISHVLCLISLGLLKKELHKVNSSVPG